MRLSMAVLMFALVLALAATEAESEKKEGISEKKIELMLDMSIAEVKELKGKPITQVNLGDTTTVLSYDDVKLIFRDDKLAGELGPWSSSLYVPLRTKEEMMGIGGQREMPSEEIEKFKKTYTIPSMRFGQAEPETIELTLGMSIEEVKELKGKPNNPSQIDTEGIRRTVGKDVHSVPKGRYLLCGYDDIMIIFRNGKLFSVR